MDWILVKHGTSEHIKAAILSHAEVTVPEQPYTFTVQFTSLAFGGYGIEFDFKAPPYAFANLIYWLEAPTDFKDVSNASGWYTSRSTNIRYFLRPDNKNPVGDTLVGATEDGESLSVYLPDVSVCRITSQVAYVGDTDLVPQDAAPVLSFDVVLDVNESFGDPGFQMTYDVDVRW